MFDGVGDECQPVIITEYQSDACVCRIVYASDVCCMQLVMSVSKVA